MTRRKRGNRTQSRQETFTVSMPRIDRFDYLKVRARAEIVNKTVLRNLNFFFFNKNVPVTPYVQYVFKGNGIHASEDRHQLLNETKTAPGRKDRLQ